MTWWLLQFWAGSAVMASSLFASGLRGSGWVHNMHVHAGFLLGGGSGDVSYFVARVPRCYCHRKSGGGHLEKKLDVPSEKVLRLLECLC